MRLIDADDLIKTIPNTNVDMYENCGLCTLLDKEDVIAIINEAPTIDIDIVITAHEDIGYEQGCRDGYAEAVGNPYGHYDCSICGNGMPDKPQYCCYCGAKMDEGERKNEESK